MEVDLSGIRQRIVAGREIAEQILAVLNEQHSDEKGERERERRRLTTEDKMNIN